MCFRYEPPSRKNRRHAIIIIIFLTNKVTRLVSSDIIIVLLLMFMYIFLTRVKQLTLNSSYCEFRMVTFHYTVNVDKKLRKYVSCDFFHQNVAIKCHRFNNMMNAHTPRFPLSIVVANIFAKCSETTRDKTFQSTYKFLCVDLLCELSFIFTVFYRENDK